MIYDDTFPEHEQFPRQMEVTIWEPKLGLSQMQINGKNVGDPLTDNNYVDDGFRFHDVFHLTHAAILGWSPVLRFLMKCRRKLLRHTEDSRRAIAYEEGILAIYWSDKNLHEGLYPNSYTLDAISNMVRNYEISYVPWEHWCFVIRKGFELWREIYSNLGGKLIVDLNQRTITLK